MLILCLCFLVFALIVSFGVISLMVKKIHGFSEQQDAFDQQKVYHVKQEIEELCSQLHVLASQIAQDYDQKNQRMRKTIQESQEASEHLQTLLGKARQEVEHLSAYETERLNKYMQLSSYESI